MNNKEKILENVKLKISISNFEKEEQIEMSKRRKNIIKMASVACLLVAFITGVSYANEISNFIKNLFGMNTSDGVDTAVNNGYVHEVDIEYQEYNGVAITVESFLMDDYNFDMNFKIKLNDEYSIEEIPRMNINDLKIKNENGDYVFITRELEAQIAKEEGLSGSTDSSPLFWGGYSMLPEIVRENEIIIHLSAYGSEEHKIIRAKKLFVSFSKIENVLNKQENNLYYSGNWNFEIDVPEEFYNSENIIYKATSCNDKGININKIEATLSNTALKISIPEIKSKKINYDALHNYDGISIYNMIALQNEYVETSDGKKFEPSGRSDGDGGYSIPAEENIITNYGQTFNLTKFDATDELTVHIFTNKKEEIVIKLEKINN